MSTLYEITVFLEDTDAGGFVYHANYLKFFERARTTSFHNVGVDHSLLIRDQQLMFVVRSCHIDFIEPAILGDKLKVETLYESSTLSTITIQQRIYKDETLLTSAKIVLAFVSQLGRIVRIPENIIKKLKH